MFKEVQIYQTITNLHNSVFAEYLFKISKYFSDVFEPERVILYVGILCLILYILQKKYSAKFIFANIFVTLFIVFLLKNIIDKSRNPIMLVAENSSAFPSGHVAISSMISILLLYNIRFVTKIHYKIFIIIFAILFPIIMSFSRIYLYAHDIYDCLASIFISIFVFVILYKNRKFISRIQFGFLDNFILFVKKRFFNNR